MSIFSRFTAKSKDRPLPRFTYHPAPIATGMLKLKEAQCPCCEKNTRVVYARTPYCEAEIEDLCPWCIADGSAARKFNAKFVDDHPLVQAGLKQEIIDEVVRRTPGYISRQQDSWLVCCDDACEFHGDLKKEEMPSLSHETIRPIFQVGVVGILALVATAIYFIRNKAPNPMPEPTPGSVAHR